METRSPAPSVVYEALRDETFKIGTLHEDSIDWRRVLNLSEKILTISTDDLRVCSYYCRAVGEIHGYGALSQALGLMRTAMEERWSRLIPAGERQRIATLESITGHLEHIFSKRTPKPDDEDVLKTCFAHIEMLQKLMQGHYGHKGPSFRPARLLAAHHLNVLREIASATQNSLAGDMGTAFVDMRLPALSRSNRVHSTKSVPS